jgi:2-dehydro-3-deoxygluconokinase
MDLSMTFAGAEVNVAIGLARLGHRARWVSVLGNDVFGRIVVRGLRGEGVDTSFVQVNDAGPTAFMVKNRRPGGEPEVFYYRRGSAMSQAAPDTFSAASWVDAGILYLTGITPALSPSCRAMVEAIVGAAAEQGIPIWLDPNHRRKLWSDDEARKTLLGFLPKTHIVLAGLAEGEMLTGSTDPRAMAASLLDAGAPRVIVKAGPEGSWYFDREQSVHVPSFPVERVVDPVGAGDGFAAGLLSGRLDGLDWPEAVLRGNALGAMVCQTRGDWEGLPTRTELDDFLARRTDAVR